MMGDFQISYAVRQGKVVSAL